MKILFITVSSLRCDNSIGNTYTNLFDRFDTYEFYSLFCRTNSPDAKFIKKGFYITENQILKNLLNSHSIVGKELVLNNVEKNFESTASKKINFIKKNPLTLFYIAKELIWKTNKWKNINLKNFLNDCNADIIFSPLIANTALNDLILYSRNHLNCKLITYAWDDEYTLNQFSLSPMYWLNRLYQRKAQKKVALASDKVYVISKLQKEVYEKCFNKECTVLTKGEKFNLKPIPRKDNIVKLVYTGNLGNSRWKSLAAIGRTLKELNSDSIKAHLFIYSQTALKKKAINAMNIEGASFFKGKVSHKEAIEQQKNADILIHVESFDLKARKQVRLSFSTKLVDYFHQAKCIFAVGPKEVASMDYLINNDAAITATNEKEIEEKLRMIIENPDIINEYGDKAWECGKKNHQIDKIQKMLKEDFENLIKNK